MIYRQYGKTGAKVSAVGFGGMRFDVSKPDEQNAQLLLYARSRGINFFDTAPGYCNDKSEHIFGIALKQMADSRDSYYVSTKGGVPRTPSGAGQARAAVEKSLRRLNVDRIDFYHIWCIRRMDQYERAMKRRGQYEGLMRCKEEGLINNIVISTHLPGPQAREILLKNEFEGVLLGLNILNFPYRWDAVQTARDCGLGVAVMNPLAGGLIPKYEKELTFLAEGEETPTQAALRFCISCPQITVTLSGVTTKEHIDTACDIADSASPFSDTDLVRIRAGISEAMTAVCTGCGYCLKSCPQNIPIPNYMQAYNEKPLFNRTDREMLQRMESYRWSILADRLANAGDCIECAACEEVCTQHLNIMERLKEIDGWERILDRRLTRLAGFMKKVKDKLRSRFRA